MNFWLQSTEDLLEQGTAGFFALFLSLFFSERVCINQRSYAAQGQKVRKEVRQDSAHTPRLSLHGGRWARACTPTRVPSDSETLPCARAPPFRSATHREVHRNNRSSTNRRSFGRARVSPSAVIAWMFTPTRRSSAAAWESDGRLSSPFPHDYTHYPFTAAGGTLSWRPLLHLQTLREKPERVHEGKSGAGGGTAGRAPLASRSIFSLRLFR